MPEYSGLKIDPFENILVCPRIETHGYCERYSPRPGKQTITPRVVLSRRSIILFYIVLEKYNYKMYQTCIKTGDSILYEIYKMGTTSMLWSLCLLQYEDRMI